MGRAIDMEKDIDTLKAAIKTLKTAFEGLASTVDSLKDTSSTKKNVDLHEETRTKIKPKKKAKETELATEEV